MKKINYKVLFGLLFFALLMVTNLKLEIIGEEIVTEELTPLFNLEFAASIISNDLHAESYCTFPCLRDLDKCSGSNCQYRWICDSGCGSCEYKNVKFGDFTQGTCNNSGPIEN